MLLLNAFCRKAQTVSNLKLNMTVVGTILICWKNLDGLPKAACGYKKIVVENSVCKLSSVNRRKYIF